MTPEDLLTPRYKVIADYPGCPFKVGAVLEKVKTVSGKWFVRGMFHDPEDFPANFKKLEWWEERKGNEAPKYIKSNNIVYKVDRWSKSFQDTHWLGCFVNKTKYIPCEELTPATSDDYNAYLQTLTVK